VEVSSLMGLAVIQPDSRLVEGFLIGDDNRALSPLGSICTK
jgi:hypothetical protein